MLRVAYLATHDALVRPDNPDFQSFFALLGAVADLRPWGGDAGELAECDALLVGGPMRPMGQAMLAGIRAHLAGGGYALVLAHAGGDACPLGVDGAASNLSALVPEIAVEDTALHVPSSMWSYDNMVAALPGRDQLVGACSLRVAEDAICLRRLDVTAHVGRSLARDPENGDEILTAASVEERQATVFARVRHGRGAISVLGGAFSLADGATDDGFQVGLARFVLDEWLVPAELARRCRGTQRHRLLHGYPMQPLGALTDGYDPPPAGAHREIIVGVLPHVFCNPTVEGCGFCAFPHDKLDQRQMRVVVGRVIAEVQAHASDGQRAAALYLGGATANLTPAPLLAALGHTLDAAFRPGEVTLEGVARYFQIDDYASLGVLRDAFSGSALRLSMGVQTFDEARLRAMGRTGFGDRATFAAVVERAHAEGLAVSGDFLINLPGQSRDEMLVDLELAAAMGFDQICVYHLVLGSQLDVPWARDLRVLAALPKNDAACASWQVARETLLARGFVQRTLTNFVRAGSPPFVYEERGFDPVACDTLGFGPASITRVADAAFTTGVKVERAGRTAEYLEGRGHRRFTYTRRDLEILHVTRGLARLRVDGAEFRRLFGRTPAAAFGAELEACVAAGLVEADGEALTLTPSGMFYSDSVAGLLAAGRVAELRGVPPALPGRVRELRGPHAVGWRKFRDPNDSHYGHMG